MATIIWENISTPVSNWTDAADWQGGVVPGSGDIAKFSIGSSNEPTYEVDVTTAVDVSELSVNAANCLIDESSAGSITSNDLSLGQGTLSLNAVNSFNHVTLRGTAEFSVDGAFGTHTIILSNLIEGTANVSLHNAFEVENTAWFTAADGVKVTYLGAIKATTDNATIQFGTDSAGRAGTVELAGTSYTQPTGTSQLIVDVVSGTVISGSGAHGTGADQMFSTAEFINLDSGATLDVGHFGSSVTLSHLAGTGTLEDSAAADTVKLFGADFNGALSGTTKLDIESANTLGGNLGTASIALEANSTLNLTNATGKYTITSAGAGSTLDIGSATVNHVDGFNSGNLTIDTNFNKHDVVAYKSGSGYEQMVIHPGHGATPISIYFYGLTSPDGIVVGSDANSHMEISFAPAEAHAAMHAAAVEHAAAGAAFVPVGSDWF